MHLSLQVRTKRSSTTENHVGAASGSAATVQARAEKHSEEEHARCLTSIPAQGHVEVCVVSDASPSEPSVLNV